MNNLYGWGLSEYLPYGGFKWLKNVYGFDVMSISKKSPTGYILEVDLQYPNELHEQHNDYPIAAEQLAVSSDVRSCCQIIVNKLQTNMGYKLAVLKS